MGHRAESLATLLIRMGCVQTSYQSSGGPQAGHGPHDTLATCPRECLVQGDVVKESHARRLMMLLVRSERLILQRHLGLRPVPSAGTDRSADVEEDRNDMYLSLVMIVIDIM